MTTADHKHPTCPMCAKSASEKNHPFCSYRCSLLDLGAWLDDSYTIDEEGGGLIQQGPIDVNETPNDEDM